jgi:hypothetical protein
MIAVLSRPDQSAVVEEFFELFKTPWEFYQPGHAYEVVLATTDQVPQVDAKLLLMYGPEPKSADASHEIRIEARHHGGNLTHQGMSVPIYGALAAFAAGSTAGTLATFSGGLAALDFASKGCRTARIGYDLFDEVKFLISAGQPVEQAHVPTLDLHIRMLRDWILNAGIALVEIPPTPAGHAFVVCLTHDIDFVGIRRHRFDHTMWGFLYRSTVGAARKFLKGRLSPARLFETWRAAASLPFVYLGWVKDFWSPFDWYLQVEKGLPATYYLIPFKGRPGDHVTGARASRRATKYDVTDIPDWMATLRNGGCEVGVHGIDAWHSVDKGRDESARITKITGQSDVGVRMHWLLADANTPSVLDRAGYAHDSTAGYNETIGYRAGTSQVFRPLGTQFLLELPMHIQDGALFYADKLNLSEPAAWRRCEELLGNARQFGGVLTLLWHDRSHGPERFWGGFYARLVDTLKTSGAWFGTASQVVDWFRKRRDVRLECSREGSDVRTRIRYDGEEIHPPLIVRLHQSPSKFLDIQWDGRTPVELDGLSSPAIEIESSL